MGVQFQLTPDKEDALDRAFARLSLRPRRALIVDDDEDWRLRLGAALARNGLEVTATDNGEEAFRLLCDQMLGTDLVIAGLKLPSMDGLSLIDRIRRVGGEQELTIVVVSAEIDAVQRAILLQTGADACLTREPDAHVVAAAAVETALVKARSRQP
jgi:CheY-like chemotaxis protein